jgi:hypothetical protein
MSIWNTSLSTIEDLPAIANNIIRGHIYDRSTELSAVKISLHPNSSVLPIIVLSVSQQDIKLKDLSHPYRHTDPLRVACRQSIYPDLLKYGMGGHRSGE